MGRHRNYISIFILLLIQSCSNIRDNESYVDNQNKDTVSKKLTIINDSLNSSSTSYGPPFELLKVKELCKDYTTTSMVSKKDYKNQCVNNKEGFLGSYNLFIKGYARPVGYMIVLCTDDPNHWNYNTKNEDLIEIEINSSKIIAWDSIKVGMKENILINFLNKSFHYKKGTLIYSEIGNYIGEFKINSDTIEKMTIKKNCSEPTRH